jgi:hypothetical protein
MVKTFINATMYFWHNNKKRKKKNSSIKLVLSWLMIDRSFSASWKTNKKEKFRKECPEDICMCLHVCVCTCVCTYPSSHIQPFWY